MPYMCSSKSPALKYVALPGWTAETAPDNELSKQNKHHFIFVFEIKKQDVLLLIV